MNEFRIPAKPGIYTLIIELSQRIQLTVGTLGFLDFSQGVYTYTGSAAGRTTNLQTRLNRHLRPVKEHHWHIDYVLTSKVATIKVIVYIKTHEKKECEVTRNIEQLASTEASIKGLGASDCHYGCTSHLHYFPGLGLEDVVSQVFDVYKRVFHPGKPTKVCTK
ncbi:MAG: GIY-YIG nuclease family protein [Candidatus Bathyarchaeota archaeon]